MGQGQLDAEAWALQIKAREAMILQLLKDVRMDITVCQLEGWPWRPYVERIRDEMNSILEETHGQSNIL